VFNTEVNNLSMRKDVNDFTGFQTNA